MAACESLQHMFENPLPSESSLSSWNPQLGLPSSPMPRSSSVTELFGELHFEESPAPNVVMPSTSSNAKNADIVDMKSGGRADENERKVEKKSGYGGPRHQSGGSLQLCTEGLGFESLGDIEDTNEEERIGTMSGDDVAVGHERDGDDDGGGYYCFWGARKRGSGPMLRRWRSTVVTRTERVGGRSCFPPPISIVNRPWVSLRGYRCDGRFMLKEVTVPAREFLHASREGGRLRLDFVQGVQEEDDDDEEDDVDDDGNDINNDENEREEEEVIEEHNEEVVEEEADVGKL